MFLSRGRLQLFKTAEEIPELAQDRLLELVEGCAEHVFRAYLLAQTIIL